MIRPRYRKLIADARAERGRLAVMITAVAVSLVAVGVVLGAWSLLGREIRVNYLGTHPADATLEIAKNVDAPLVKQVQAMPEVTDAEARDVIRARVRVGDEWRPFLLFVVDDFSKLRLNRFYRESGTWPPPAGSVLLERTALNMAQAKPGDSLLVKTHLGNQAALSVAGVVHDPGLAPAWQERSVYAYATRDTLSYLGLGAELHELRVTFASRAGDLRSIEAAAERLSLRLAQQGVTAVEVRVPPPGQHPHQRQMNTILLMLMIFAVLALVLSSVLVATSLASILARQVREIGIMKTLGASRVQLAGVYSLLVTLLGVLALLPALPLGYVGARVFSASIAKMLNFTITNGAIPAWVYATQIIAGLLMPLALAALPILRAVQATVRVALDQNGAGAGTIRQWSSRLPVVLRSALRRPMRFALTAGLLTAGGALFMTALAVSRAWVRNVDKIYETRSYDLEVRFNKPETRAIAHALARLPGVKTVEPWAQSAAALARPGHVDVVHSYPDRGHGTLSVMAPPVATELVHFPVLAGRWLIASDRKEVVMNHVAASLVPNISLGEPLTISIEGKVMWCKLVGIVEEVGSPGIIYITPEAFEAFTGTEGQSRFIRVSTSETTAQGRRAVTRAVEGELDRRQLGVETVVPFSEVRTAVGDHIVILTRALMSMALVLAIVGILGLSSSVGVSVVERTREIGVMKALGASSKRISRVVMGEALLIGFTGWVGAIVLSLPLTWLVEGIVGRLGFLAPLPFVISVPAMFIWAVLLGVGAVVASLTPASRAAALSVREALTVTG